jgi:hypothetical protein
VTVGIDGPARARCGVPRTGLAEAIELDVPSRGMTRLAVS